ncbi:hypothetical protein N8812_01270 [Acidimicrobiia bacterium]|nr:hypothetical protein [Acidimicrobiia bacterium]
MKNYGSNTYWAVAVLAGVGAGGLFLYISEDIIFGGILSFLVYIIYYWFSRVLYGLEQNGEVLSSISEQLEFIVSNGSIENQTNDEEARIEVERIAEEERLRSEEESIEPVKKEFEGTLKKSWDSLPLAILIKVTVIIFIGIFLQLVFQLL